MANVILEVTTENKNIQDQHAHNLASQLTPYIEQLHGSLTAVANQFGLSPALIVLELPDGIDFPHEFPGVDMAGVKVQSHVQSSQNNV